MLRLERTGRRAVLAALSIAALAIVLWLAGW